MHRFIWRTSPALLATLLAPLALAQFGNPVYVNDFSLRGGRAEASDFDGDGHQDVLIQSDLGVLGWRPGLGAGAFGAARAVAEFDFVVDLVVADLDGDSDLDLVVRDFDGNANRRLSWHEFRNGDFAPRVLIGDVNDGIQLQAADMDGDGDLDLLTFGTILDEILYLENLGGGSFATQPRRVGTDEAGSVAAADLDGDGDQDVVVGLSGSLSSGFTIHRNDGGGVWSRSVIANSASSGRYQSFAFGDLDGDGDLDIVARPANGSTDWYEQTGPLDFINREQFPSDGVPRSMDIGDMDADGDLDVLMYGDGLAWAENTGAGSFRFDSIDALIPGNGSARLVDLDGSGRLDILYSAPVVPNGTQWKPNLGAGQFGPDTLISVLEMSSPDEVVSADFDGDGDLDVAAVSKTDRLASVWKNHGGRSFGSALTLDVDLQGGADVVDIITADVDGDGDHDVVVAAQSVRWYENLGAFSGQFAPQETLWDGQRRTTSLRAADLNGDGLTDIVGNALSDRAIYVLFGVAGGPDGSAPTLVGNIPWDPIDIAVGDFDSDGDMDVATVLEAGPELWWIENTTGGTFAAPIQLGSSVVSGPVRSIETADFDQDGNGDLLIGGSFGVSWTRGVGDGTFEAVVDLTGFLNVGPIISVTVMDVNGDSRADVVASSSEFSGPMPDRISWARNLGLGGFESGGSFPTELGFVADLHAADLDGDLDQDLLATSKTVKRIAVLPNVDGVGTSYCGPATLHSEARRASVTGSGSTLIADDDLTLMAFDLPLNSAGYFLASRAQGFVANPAGSQGNLCLGGEIGRYVDQVGSSGSTGTLPLAVRPSSIVQPLGAVSAVSGEIWSFQCWFRDRVAGMPTSNFSSGFSVRFQ